MEKKYIDSEKLIAEIERMREINRKAIIAEHIKADTFHGRAQAINHLFEFITSLQQEQPSLPSNLDGAAEIAKELAYKTWSEGDNWSDAAIKTFKAGVEWQQEQYECIPTEEAYMRGFAQGAKEERKELTPLINRLCEAILFEWKDAADLARKTLTQIKAREE